MSEQAQVGDTVRLMIPIVGVVKPEYGGSVRGYSIHGEDGRTVEILSRAAPPLPSEPGTWWLDATDYVWFVSNRGILHRQGADWAIPDTFAPFRQLVLK